MPRGTTKKPRKPLTQTAAESAPLAAVQEPRPDDRLAALVIPETSLTETAAELSKSNAYAARRINELSKNDAMAKVMRIRQIARKKKYSLDTLIHSPDELQDALDDFDITCFQLGIYPLQEILSFWLNTTRAQLSALTSTANTSQPGRLLAMHSDYCVSVISSTALIADKPPVFSIYYLKSVHSMFDSPCSGGIFSLGNTAITQNITINAAEIAKNSQLFSEEIDVTPEPK